MEASCAILLLLTGYLNWWTLVKSLTGNNDSSRTIPPIEHNGNLVFDDIEKILVCEILAIFVSSVFNFGHFWFPCV
jgi:cytochrome c oxidase assembly factor CtaG